jgi:16S rRNA (cytosine967-C5)-methyltransferase
MKKTPRHIAVEILNRVEEHGAFAEPLLDAYLSRALLTNIHDRRLITQIVYGTLRMRGRLDWIIDHLYRGNFISMDVGIKNILRTGLYQFLFTERIPDFAIVDEAVEITKILHPAQSGLVNAILRNAIRKKDDIVYPEIGKDPSLHISIVHSHPLWMVKKWITIFGVEETAALCRANNEIPPTALRVNTLKTTRERTMEELLLNGFDVKVTDYSPDGLILSNPAMSIRETKCYTSGHIQVQDEASQLIARLADPKPGENILDICAGVGGKTTHIAEVMNNTGSITAIDISEKKIEALRKNATRLGVTIVDTQVGDAREKQGKAFSGRFDKIIVDAPCSGLGTLRRNPEIKWRTTPEGLKKCAVLQKALMESAALYLKKGGFLIYSTCTIMPEENEEVIKDFMSHHPDFMITHPLNTINSRLVDNRGYFRSYPHRHGTDGFYGAVLVKKSSKGINRNDR